MEHVVSTALLLSRQKSLLLLVLFTSCSAQSTYYVTPTPDTPCPGEPCHTLSEYAADWHFQSNTTMEFLPGNHTLEQTMSVTNLMCFTLHGDSSSLPELTSRIACTSSLAGFVFTDITGLHITALAFISSGHNGSGLVSAISVQQSNISNCSFLNHINSATVLESYHNIIGGALTVIHSTITITENTFQNNSAESTQAAGLFVYNSSLNLTGNTFKNNRAESVGGGLYAENSNLNLTGNTFQNNSAENFGGGLYAENTNLNLTWNTFQNNSAESFGGGLCASNSTLNLTGNTFKNNSAKSFGGGLYAINSIFDLTGNTVQNNSAERAGGGICAPYSTLNLTGNTFQDNSARFDGGGLFGYNSNLNLTGNTFKNNSAKRGGGGLYVDISNLNLIGNIFQNNYAIELGGGVFVVDSILDLTENTVENNSVSFHGAGLYVYDTTLTLTRNTFQNNSAGFDGGGLHVYNSTLDLTGNTFQNNSAEGGGGSLKVYISILNLTGNTFHNNTAGFDGGFFSHIDTVNLTGNPFADRGGALYVDYSTLSLTGNTFKNNSAERGGGGIYAENSNINLTGNIFQDNSASLGGTLYVDYTSNITFMDDYFTDSFGQLGGALLAAGNSNVRMCTVVIQNSRAEYGGGIAAMDGKLELLERTIIDNNTASFGGGLYAYRAELNINAIFTSNSANDGGGGIYASRSILSFTENTTITRNIATDGGGVLLSGDSKLLLHQNMTLYITSNHARKTGGAIKVEESNPLSYCILNIANNYIGSSDCFFQIPSQTGRPLTVYFLYNLLNYIEGLKVNRTLVFGNNIAIEAGTDLYGGSIDRCYLSNIDVGSHYSGPPVSGYVFDVISGSNNENKLSISSDPLHICTCRDNHTDCTSSYDSGPVYPGGTVQVPVIAQGQRNGTTAAIIRVIHTPNNISYGSLEYSQNISSNCNTLKYTIRSRAVGTAQKMTLYAEGPCSATLTNTLTLTVDIQYCPHGFQLAVNEPTCICEERLQQFTNTCLVDSTKVLRQQNDEFWVGYGNDNDSKSRGLITHPHCPFDYCTTKETYLAVDDSDKQCNYNRSGLLCGRCSENLSLALGSSRCLQCPNTYLSLLAAFAFAGIALVLFLLVLRLTVAVGTVNGLFFYANIIAVNSKVLFKPQATTVLTVFIAWLNLDLGIETCFYNGMDAYVKTWLQFLFPLYVWVLISMIILGSYYSGRVAKIFGRNPIAVLATLILMSYAKLLRTVIAVLSFTSLEYPNNLQVAAWLYDGNIRYFSGKHIPLFTAALVCLIFLFLPYTTLLIFGQWFQAKSHLKIFSWINNRYVKPFLDAYHAPYTDKHRYWTGLMLLLRLVLFLISAVNALGDPSVNLLAIGSITGAILPIILGSTIYKTWILALLETSFILNLVILCLASLYIRSTGGNQNAATSTSIGMAFATFIGIVIYHSVQQIKGTRLWRRLFQRSVYVRVPLTDIDSGPEDPPDRVFQSNSAPTRTVVDMRELREACMATD